MALSLVLEVVSCMSALPMASKVRGDPQGGVVGLYFFNPTVDHSSVVFVCGASAARVA